MNTRGGSSRFTSAHGIALVALFVALSGIAYASVANNSVKSKHIVNGQVKTADLKNNAVKTGKVKDQNLLGADLADDTVTGAQVEEDTLGTVGNADRVDGLDARTIRFAAAANTASTQVLSLGHLTIEASCSAGNVLTVVFKTSRSNSFIHIGGTTQGASFYQEDDDFDAGDSEGLIANDGSRGTFSFYSPAGISPLTQPGHTISGSFLAEQGGAVPCLFVGNVLGSAPSGIGIIFPRADSKGAERIDEAAPRANSGPNEDG